MESSEAKGKSINVFVDCPQCGEPEREEDVVPFFKDGTAPMCLLCHDATWFIINISPEQAEKTINALKEKAIEHTGLQ